MTFWVGRWVAAMRVTAGARPRRAIVSVSLIASGASSASSAYSSMMITRAGRAGEGCHSHLPWSARCCARANKMVTASAASANITTAVAAVQMIPGTECRGW
jgi:hypothetical protein